MQSSVEPIGKTNYFLDLKPDIALGCPLWGAECNKKVALSKKPPFYGKTRSL